MHASGFLAYQLARTAGSNRGHGPKVRRGNEILEGPYPKSFTQFVGQTTARSQILAAVTASTVMGEPMNHMLLASGTPGCGKTALARLTAHRMGAGMVEISGLAGDKDAAAALKVMKDGDVLFLDEALALDTPIPTPSGWTTMGDLKIGDWVLGAIGLPVRVSNATAVAFDRPCYKITFTDGLSIVADANHKWLAQPMVGGGTKYLSARVVTTQQMAQDNGTAKTKKVKDRPWRIPLARPVELPEADLPVDPYLLGQWLGNGNAGQGYIGVRIDLAPDVLNYLREIGEYPVILDLTGGDDNEALVRVSLHGAGATRGPIQSDFRMRMERLGIYHVKALPTMYLRGSIEQRLKLVQGLMDTDGYISPTGYCTFSNTNASIIDGMLEVLRSLGYQPRLIATQDDRIGARGKHQQCWQIHFRGSTDAPPFRFRDAEKVKTGRLDGKKIISITPVDSVPVRCIAVDSPDHLFLAGDSMAVTHNCHRLVGKGKARAEWLLTLLQDGELHMPTGVVVAPRITVIAATTDKERLPQTILDRFIIQPILEPYSLDEGVEIARLQATRLGFGTEHLPMPDADHWLRAAASAARHNPRRIGKLLSSVRDVALSTKLSNLSDAGYDISLALQWNGLTQDGITRSGQDYLLALLAYGGTAGAATLRALLNEELLVQTERDLVQDGFIEVTPRGRTLTDYGNERAIQLATNKMEATA